MRRALTVGLMLVVALGWAQPAMSVAPGSNGRIVFMSHALYIHSINPDGTNRTVVEDQYAERRSHPVFSPDGQRIAVSINGDIYTMDPDGTHRYNITSSNQSDEWPAWSPDGGRIAWEVQGKDRSDYSGQHRIAIMASNGTGRVNLTDGSYYTGQPAWSPDGSQIAFMSGKDFDNDNNFEIYKINVDGTGETRLTNNPGQDEAPDWSPDGSKIVFQTAQGHIWTMNADGTNQQDLTEGEHGIDPSWSPDGSRIAFVKATFILPQPPFNPRVETDVMTMDTDGSDVQNVTNTIETESESEPSWQPLQASPPVGYPRPRQARSIRWSLVPAFRSCTSPNRLHGPPLEYDSCFPAIQESGANLTVGGPDVSGTPAESSGSLRLTVVPGNPGTLADEADVRLDLQISDVRRRADNSDYAGELVAQMNLRLTDRLNSTGFTSGTTGTIQDSPFGPIVPCAPTPDPAVGSTCAVSTTADAVLPGSIPEGKRSIWGLAQLEVLDGGADNDGDTAPNKVFARPGLFVP
jgi:TolB protein